MIPPGIEIERALQETSTPMLIDTSTSDNDDYDDYDYDNYEDIDDNSNNNNNSDDDENDAEDRLEMLVIQEARPGDEIYNTYGYHGNAHLLARYGFAEDVNPCDVVSIHIDIIRKICEQHTTSPVALQERIDFFTMHMDKFESMQKDEEEEEEDITPTTTVLPEYFGITFGGMPDPLLTALLSVIRMRDDAFKACQQSSLHMTRSIEMLHSLVDDTLGLLSQEHQGVSIQVTPLIANLCRVLREVARQRLLAYTPPETTLEQDQQRREVAVSNISILL
jgi:hypothetical protein